MLYEIDFLPVGDKEKSGDAICLRYSSDNGITWTVGVVDGGTQDSGEKMCEHIGKHYDTETIDFLVCTHPHQDHASGLSVVLEKMNVKKILMHCPWDYVDCFYDKVTDRRVTKESLARALREGHSDAYKIYEAAGKEKIQIYSAFSDNNDHGIPYLHIVGPSREFYLKQVINFSSINEVTEDIREHASAHTSFSGRMREAINWVKEAWNIETLEDPDEDATSCENNSSAILLFEFGDEKCLLTADAGTPALDEAVNKIENIGRRLQNFSFIQAPHHGSKRNVGPTLLNRLVGYPKSKEDATSFVTFISAARKGEPKHPSKRVSNAFTRRGAKVIVTQGSYIHHYSGNTLKRDWSTATPLPFYNEVEGDDD